jgi:hypothetical protein
MEAMRVHSRKYSSAYYSRHKDSCIARASKWAAENPDKRLAICRKSTRKNIEKVYAATVEYRRANPEKYKAHVALNNAVASGVLVKPLLCEQCGKEKRLDGHHKDYSKLLAVEWLCRKCHKTRKED